MTPRTLNRSTSVSLAFLLCLSLLIPMVAFGQNAQSGELKFKEEEKKANPDEVAQDEAIAYFENLLSKKDVLADGISFEPERLTKNAATHLAAVHLFCTLREGKCPVLLEGLYESEVIRSVHAGKGTCPNMVRFWKQWIDADMERRLDLDLKITLLSKHSQFKKKDRRKFLNCSKSVGQLLKNSDGESIALMKTRFAEGGDAIERIEKARDFLNDIKEEIPSIFRAVKIRR